MAKHSKPLVAEQVELSSGERWQCRKIATATPPYAPSMPSTLRASSNLSCAGPMRMPAGRHNGV